MIYNLPRAKKKVAYLRFSSPSTFSIKVTDPGWSGTLYYSTDAQNWNTWDGSEVSAAQIDDEYALLFRGTGNTKIGGSNTGKAWTFTGTAIA